MYQQDTRRNNGSDIYFFDLVTKVRAPAPERINTPEQREYMPSISGDWVLFARLYPATGDTKVLLYNLSTDELRKLAQTSGRWSAWPGQVNGNYAVWHESGQREWEVFLYDIDAGTMMQIPNPRDKANWGASVSATGTVFYGRSNNACGRNERLMAYPIGGPQETLVSFSPAHGFSWSYALDNGDGTTDVFYDPYPCSAKDEDIYKVTYP